MPTCTLYTQVTGLVQELHHAVFQSNSLLDTVCPLSNKHDPAIDKLAHTFLVSTPKPSLPSRGKGKGRGSNKPQVLAGTSEELSAQVPRWQKA
jgi:hypothetical protein